MCVGHARTHVRFSSKIGNNFFFSFLKTFHSAFSFNSISFALFFFTMTFYDRRRDTWRFFFLMKTQTDTERDAKKKKWTQNGGTYLCIDVFICILLRDRKKIAIKTSRIWQFIIRKIYVVLSVTVNHFNICV